MPTALGTALITGASSGIPRRCAASNECRPPAPRSPRWRTTLGSAAWPLLFVLALSRSLQNELAGRGVRVQVVLPGVTATDFWEIAGSSVRNMPQEWVMTADDMVDAALTGLDAGEFVTVPALADLGMWETYEKARQTMSSHLTAAEPAERYR
jgi:short-subunit dehydrogenase